MKAGPRLLAGLLLAVLAGCSDASAGEAFAAPNAASDDTPARRAPVMPATPDSKQVADADPGGAILNPLSPVPVAVTNSASPPAPPEASVATTVIASLAGIAAIAYLLHKLSS